MPGIHESHPFPGRLIAVEGIDGSGKSTQATLLAKYLSSRGVPVFFTQWNSSALVKSATKIGKKKGLLTPTTFSLLHATDFADRLTYEILPPLKAGMVVIADRYAFTAFARDTARAVDRNWVRRVYNFAWKPDITFYFRIPVKVALQRLLTARAKIKYYEAGMDVGLGKNVEDSFLRFQQRVVDHYDDMITEFGFTVLNAEEPIPNQQIHVRQVVIDRLKAYLEGYPDKDIEDIGSGENHEAPHRVLRTGSAIPSHR